MRKISIILPLYNARPLLPQVLPPLQAAVERGEAVELLVVDDGSTDGGAEYCREEGVQVLSSGWRLGPGGARNVGTEAAGGDVVLFIDSDVIMHADVPRRVQEAFERGADCVATFGSYDDRPQDRGLVSQYLNLRHHYVHQQGSEDASTFWAGCGAVDRRAFLDAGGFDLERFPHPSIEDIELGYRLRERGGRILLDKRMQCTHLKRWSLRSMVLTDVFRRALPWTRLMLEGGKQESQLNLSSNERFRAALAGLLSISLVAGIVYPPALGLSLALLVTAFLANRGLYLLILRRNGIPHMLAGVLLHQIYYHYSVLCYLYCLAQARVSRAKSIAAR